MRTLYLLRHAKSDWDESSTADFDRPLSKRGFSAAPRMGLFMQENKFAPERIFCSSAKRTRQTLGALQPYLGDCTDVQFMERIYTGGAQEYFNLLRNHGENAQSLMLIGHNPSIQGLALALSGSGDETARQQMATKYPTAGLSVIQFKIDNWSEIAESSGHLELFVTPRLIT